MGRALLLFMVAQLLFAGCGGNGDAGGDKGRIRVSADLEGAYI